jgi:hypothetical protein
MILLRNVAQDYRMNVGLVSFILIDSLVTNPPSLDVVLVVLT